MSRLLKRMNKFGSWSNLWITCERVEEHFLELVFLTSSSEGIKVIVFTVIEVIGEGRKILGVSRSKWMRQ